MYRRNPIDVVDQGISPLSAAGAPPGIDPRNIYGRAYEVFRVGLVDTDAPPPKSSETYFATTTRQMRTSPTTGKAFKKPRTSIVPGALFGTIAFVDFHPYSKTGVYIDYIAVRGDMRNRGAGWYLMSGFYALLVERKIQDVHWGRIMNTHAWKLLERMQEEFPNIESSGQRDF